MRKLFILTFLLLCSSLVFGQRYNWLRVFQSSGFASTINQKVATKDNSVYVAGEFQGSISFGTIVLNASQPTGRDIYVAKYDTLGNIQWAIRGGSTNTNFDQFRGIAIDDAGNVYVAGIYSQVCEWGSIIENGFYFNDPSSREAFIVKIDGSGTAKWIQTLYSPTSTFISTNSISRLESFGDKVYMCGDLFNPVTFKGTTISASSPQPAQTENLWVGRMDTSGAVLTADVPIAEANTGFNSLFLHDFDVVGDDEFVVSGEINGSFNFGQTLENTGATTLFFAKFSNPATLEWNRKSTSGNPNTIRTGVNKKGEVVFGGTFSTSLAIGGKSITTPNFNQWFTGRLNPSGAVEELKTLNTIIGFTMNDVEINDKLESYITGSFRDSIVINGVKRFSNGSNDMVVVKLDSTQEPIWFQTGGGGNSDAGMDIGVLNSGDILLLSNYRGLAQFGSVVLTGSPTFAPTFLLTKLTNCGDYEVPLSFLGDTSFCAGGSVRIFTSALGNETFQWMKDSIVLAGEVFRDILATQSGNYQVIVNGSGCIDTSRAVQVSVGTPPTVTLAPLDSVCVSDTAALLTGGSPIGGYWSGIGVTDSFFNASIAGIGNTAITYTFDNNGCKDSVTRNIYVEPSPTVFFAPLNDICETASPITLTNAFPPGGDFVGNGVTAGIFYPDSAGVGNHLISYVYTSPNGCSNSASQNIHVDSPDPIDFDSIPSLCQLDTAYLLTEGTPFGGIYFGPGINGDFFEPQSVGPGTYTIGYALDNDCGIDTIYRDITVLASPVVNLNSFTDLCIDAGVQSLSGGSPLGGVFSGPGVSGAVFDPSLAGVGSFNIIYEYTAPNGCPALDSSTQVVNPLPTVSLSPDTSICFGDTVQLMAGGGSSYSWSNGMTGNSIVVNPSSSTDYGVIVTDSNSCVNSDTVSVIVNPLPTVQIIGIDTICIGDSTTLTATGANSYLWSTASSSSSITVSPDSSRIYSVEGIDLNGCSSSGFLEVIVNPLPVINFPALADLCIDNGPLTLNSATPTGGTYYGTGVSGSDFDPGASGVGTFVIGYDYVDANGCLGMDSASITVNALPVVTVSPDTFICIGDTVLLNAFGGDTYSWSNGMSGSTIAVNPSTSTMYSVLVTDSNSCQNLDSVLITVNPLPTISISGIDTICVGDSTTLIASGADTYLWGMGQGGNQITVSPSGTTSYSVTGTDLNGCSNSLSYSVHVNALPIVSLGAISPLCEDASPITLSTGSPIGGIYSGAGVSGGVFDPSIGPGSYQIQYDFTDANGCSSNDSSQVTVNALPAIAVSADTQICIGQSVTLDAQGGSVYVWSPGGAGQSITVSPTLTTVYRVSVTDSNSCTSNDSVQIIVNPLPTVSISGIDTICQGIPIQLLASGAQDYQWSTGDTINPVIVVPMTTGSYAVTGTDLNGCQDVDSFLVTVNTAPPVTINPFSDLCIDASPITLSGGSPLGGNYSGTGVSGGSFDPQLAGVGLAWITYQWADSIGCSGFDSTSIQVNALPVVNITGDTLICIGDTSILVASGGTSYLWSTGSGLDSTEVSPLNGTYYSVLVTDSNSCSSADSIFVNVLDFPTLSVTADTIVCSGSSLTLKALSNAGNYSWNTGSLDDSIVVAPASPMSYWVSTANGGLCITTDTINVGVNPNPVFSLGVDTVILNNCTDSSFVFTVPPGFVAYQWQNGSTDSTFQANFFIQLVGTTDYVWLRVQDSNSCFGFDSVMIMYEVCTDLEDNLGHGITTGIYPNPNDGSFQLEGIGFPEGKSHIQIFDNLGKLVHQVEIENPTGRLNALFQLQELSSGTYHMIIDTQGIRKRASFIKE